MANYPQELAQNAVCQSHTGHGTGLWFLPTRPVRLNTNECSLEVTTCFGPLRASSGRLSYSRKQANVSVRMARISFGALPCRGEKNWRQLASPCCWNRARPWHASEVVSFLVGVRTYQYPGTICDIKSKDLISRIVSLNKTYDLMMA